MTPRFDPTRAVVFDLARGALRDDEGQARLNIPLALLVRLLESAGHDSARDFGHGLGSEVGRRVSERLGSEKDTASTSTWVEHLGGHLALIGFGSLRAERWGRALVLRVEAVPSSAVALLGWVLEGAMLRAFGRRVSAVSFAEHVGAAENTVSFLVLAENRASAAQSLRDGGRGLGAVIDELHRLKGTH
jgi:hypothetical protein